MVVSASFQSLSLELLIRHRLQISLLFGICAHFFCVGLQLFIIHEHFGKRFAVKNLWFVRVRMQERLIGLCVWSVRMRSSGFVEKACKISVLDTHSSPLSKAQY